MFFDSCSIQVEHLPDGSSMPDGSSFRRPNWLYYFSINVLWEWRWSGRWFKSKRRSWKNKFDKFVGSSWKVWFWISLFDSNQITKSLASISLLSATTWNRPHLAFSAHPPQFSPSFQFHGNLDSRLDQCGRGVYCRTVSVISDFFNYILTIRRIVSPGQTIASTGYTRSRGGKGANVALAAANAGGEVSLRAHVGTDGLWLKVSTCSSPL